MVRQAKIRIVDPGRDLFKSVKVVKHKRITRDKYFSLLFKYIIIGYIPHRDICSFVFEHFDTLE